MEYPTVPLSTAISHRKEFIEIDDTRAYKRCRVQLHAKGIVLRDEVSGSEIKTKRQQVCRPGDLLVAEIDAKHGGYGIVPDELAGAIVSSHYFLFEIDEETLNRQYLGYYIRTPVFRDQVAAQGSTNYAAIRPQHVLDYFIPLPSLPEQQRIVARVEALSAKIEEARRLQNGVAEGIEALLRSMLSDDSDGAATPTRMSDLVSLRDPDVQVHSDENYHFAGVYSFGRGVFSGQVKAGIETSYDRLTRLRTDDFVYPKLMAWEGALGVVPPECDGLVVSTEFPVFEINQERVLPEVLDVYFRTPAVWQALSGTSTGTNVRRRRLHPREFLSHEMPLPPMSTQLRLRQVRKRGTHIGKLRSEIDPEFNALLPAILDLAIRGGCEP